MATIEIDRLKTPCFVLDEVELKRSVGLFRKALDDNFKRSIIGYSVKTNSLPYLLGLLKDEGCYAEVVSHDEYQLARLVGFPIERIIYNGPMKSKETFLEAVEGGAIVNIETKRELRWLESLPSDGDYKIGIRLNIDINAISPLDAKGQDDYSRFGFSDDTDDFKLALAAIAKLKQVTLAGIHIHRMSKTRSVSYYGHLVEYACAIIRKYDIRADYLDIGGGYYGIFPSAPTYEDYSDVFADTLNRHGMMDICVIVEPGTALIASAMSYYSTVIDIKKQPDRVLVVTDGTRNDVDPLFTKKDYIKEILYRNPSADTIPEQVITGSSCIENDKLFVLADAKKIEVNDIVKYNNVGSYTMCLSPNFINYFPNVYSINEDKLKLVRTKWTANDYVKNSLFYV